MTQETIKNLLPKLVDDLKEKSRSPSTILAYRADLEQLIVYLTDKGKATPDQVKSTDIESFRDSLLAQKYTPKSVSRKLNAVKTFFRWMISQKIITFNPSEEVAHPKITPSIPKFLSQMEYRALRDVIRDDTRISAIVELILQTGVRISEVANLKIPDVKDTEITVEPNATQHERTIP